MNRIKIFCILLLILNSCGFQKINTNLEKYGFNEINIEGDKKLTYILNNRLNYLIDQNGDGKFNLYINLKSNKEIKIKDISGKATRYNLTNSANVEIKNLKNQNVIKKNFTVSQDYEVATNYSDTIFNEKNIIQNNINKLSEDITKYLQLVALN